MLICMSGCDIDLSVSIIIIMEIYKVPTLWLKAMNKHSITHIMHIKIKKIISNLTKSGHIM